MEIASSWWEVRVTGRRLYMGVLLTLPLGSLNNIDNDGYENVT